MKQFIILSLCLILGMISLTAQPRRCPATPHPIRVTQPNGDTLMIRLHGDENYHFTTTLDGYRIVKSKKGYYMFAKVKDGKIIPSFFNARMKSDRNNWFLKRYLKKMAKDSKLKFEL